MLQFSLIIYINVLLSKNLRIFCIFYDNIVDLSQFRCMIIVLNDKERGDYMLIQFSVENFKSFKDKATLSLVPSKDASHPGNLTILNKSEQVLNTVAIYGANAAGKSNLFKALTTAIMMVRTSSQLQKNDRLSGIVPFLFDKKMAAKPTSFEFVFITDGIKYIYGFSATQTEVVSEYLYAYYSAKPSTIFEREGNEFNFTKDKRALDQIADKNTPNKLFLSTATVWNYSRTEPAYSWFDKGINTYPEYEHLHPIAFDLFEKDADEKIHQFVIDLLRESDINIQDYLIKSEPINEQDLMQIFGPLYQAAKDAKMHEGKKQNVFMDHLVTNDDGSTSVVHVSLADESKGTENLFLLAPILMKALSTGETVVIDEIERSLHPLLVKHIIGYFNDPDLNPSNAQLIFNTHNLELMSLDIFRRDQIYFVDKSGKTGASELYSLDEFSVRAEENIKKGYLLGRFGAIPSILEGYAK